MGKCSLCGFNIDAVIALNNTGRPDMCDNCAIEGDGMGKA